MCFGKYTVIPGVLVTRVGLVFVIKLKIAQDVRAVGISGANLGTAMEQAIELVEIHGLCHIRGDNPIMLVSLLHTVYLNSEQDRDAVLLELAGERDRLRTAPTVAI